MKTILISFLVFSCTIFSFNSCFAQGNINVKNENTNITSNPIVIVKECKLEENTYSEKYVPNETEASKTIVQPVELSISVEEMQKITSVTIETKKTPKTDANKVIEDD